MDIERRQSSIIRLVKQIRNEALLRKMEEWLTAANAGDDVLAELTRPLRPDLDVDALAREQGYNGIDKAQFDALVKELDIQEDPMELLEELKRMG